jgi:regulator of cell morphogenesis and NO signaling
MPTATQPLREIVANQPSAGAILQRFDLDLCTQADVPLERACAELQLSVDQVLEKLVKAEESEPGAQAPDPASYSTTRLIQHIVRVHHRRVRQELPALAEMAQKLARRRADRAPELKHVDTLVAALRDELLEHIEKEEQILFPYIAQMGERAYDGVNAGKARFRSVAQPVEMMHGEHEKAARIISELRQQTSDFALPEWACTTHSALYAGLAAFEADLDQHVYLEEEVLFPRAIELEAKM